MDPADLSSVRAAAGRVKKPEAWADMQSLRDKLRELGLYQDLYGAEQPDSEGSV